jgi:hypothetical protein
MIAPFVGSASTKVVPSLLKALPALNARMGSVMINMSCQTRRVSAPALRLMCTATTMSFSNLNFEETPAIWGQDTPQTADIVRDAIQKEAVIKYDVWHLLTDSAHLWFREILASQEDLRSACLGIPPRPLW